MKKALLVVVLLFSAGVSFAQNKEEEELRILRLRSYTCEEVANRYALLYVACFENNMELVPDVLQFWQEKCGNSEPLQRAKTLYAIDQKLYIDATIGYDIMDMVLNYQNREERVEGETVKQRYEKDRAYFCYVPVNEGFDAFTKELATKNSLNYPDNSIEYAWWVFYSSAPDTLFKFVQKNKYKDSKLTYRYYDKVTEVRKMLDWNYAAFAGVWLPLGDMSAMGVHPELGLLLGGRGGRLSVDLDVAIRFLNTAEYKAKQGNNYYPTKRFFGTYIGLDFGYDVFTKKKNTLLALAGIGWDGLEPIEKGKFESSQITFVSSYNFNVGLGLRHQLTPTTYMAAQLKCNIVDYTLNDIVNYKGVPLEFKLIFGGISNPMKKSILKRLKYDK